MKKIILFLIAFILLPVSVFAETIVKTEAEYEAAMEDPTIDKIVLGEDITITDRHDFILSSIDRTLDLNGHMLDNTDGNTQSLYFQKGGLTFKVTDSVGTGLVLNKSNFLTIYNEDYQNNKIELVNFDYENNKYGSGLFLYSSTTELVSLVVDNVFFYYPNNAPLSEMKDFNIIYLKVLGKNQNNPIGFYNDANVNYLSDIITNDHEIFVSGSLYPTNYSEIWARDVYFSTNATDKSLLVRLNDKRLVTFDYNGMVAHSRSRFVATVGDNYTLDETLLNGVEIPVGKRLKGFLVNLEPKNQGDKIVINEDTTITYLWEDIPDSAYQARLENVNFGELDKNFESGHYNMIFRIWNTGSEILNSDNNFLKIDVETDTPEAFDFWISHGGSYNFGGCYNAGSVEPVEGTPAGEYKATMILSYDPDGPGTERDWIVLDTKTVEYVVKSDAIPVFRMFNPINGEHLYTTDAHEVEVIFREQGWGKEGIGWYTSEYGKPVYRLFNAQLGNHLYTSDTYEISIITKQGWTLDFDGAPVMYSKGEIPIYRLFNPGLQGQHHLTTDLNEYNVIPMWGWQQEGISMKALQTGVPETTHYFK